MNDANPVPENDEEIARAMMQVCEQFSQKYPGIIFMFVHGRQEAGDLTKMGLSTNLADTESAMHFFKLILMQQEAAKTKIIPDENATNDMA